MQGCWDIWIGQDKLTVMWVVWIGESKKRKGRGSLVIRLKVKERWFHLSDCFFFIKVIWISKRAKKIN